MGFFDFLKKKKEPGNSLVSSCDVTNIEPYFETLAIPENIKELLWFADGKYKNYNPEKNKHVFQNELFKIEYFFENEPSLIYSQLPISGSHKRDPQESIGYFPSYRDLSPEERRTYLEWLCDVTQPVDIGYVFVYYYGLERHLIFGKCKEAVDMILLLRQHHKNNSFNSYSSSALIMASVLHRDRDMFERVTKEIEDTPCDNVRLIAKYLLREDLTVDEIISLSSKAGFKNKRYIKEYPELFRDKLSFLLKAEFGGEFLPFYNLKTEFSLQRELTFANISLSEETRSPALPSIISNGEFTSLIYNLLNSAHEKVKEELAERRKKGLDLQPKKESKNNRGTPESEPTVHCPYCKKLLESTPKKKKKCPNCGNYIYVRTKQSLFPSNLLTNDEAIAADEMKKLDAHGITYQDFIDEKKSLTQKESGDVSNVDVCLNLYNKLLSRTKDPSHLKFLYFEIAYLLYTAERDFFKYLQMSAEKELMMYKKNGVEKVTISTCGEGSCPECKKLESKVFTIEEALVEMPIPCRSCSFQLKNGKAGWCRCQYLPYR